MKLPNPYQHPLLKNRSAVNFDPATAADLVTDCASTDRTAYCCGSDESDDAPWSKLLRSQGASKSHFIDDFVGHSDIVFRRPSRWDS